MESSNITEKLVITVDDSVPVEQAIIGVIERMHERDIADVEMRYRGIAVDVITGKSQLEILKEYKAALAAKKEEKRIIKEIMSPITFPSKADIEKFNAQRNADKEKSNIHSMLLKKKPLLEAKLANK